MKEATELNEQVFAALKQVAEKLGTTSEQMYGALVKQAKVEMIKAMVRVPISIVGVATIIWFNIHYSDTLGYFQKSGDTTLGGIFALIGSLICSVLFCGLGVYDSINTVVDCAVNPDYFAINKILAAIKPQQN